MALPYTDSPLGALLATLGQGIPALGQQHRARDIQDQKLAMEQAEMEARLKTEGLQQQQMQAGLDEIPTRLARNQFDFASKVDPLAAILDRGNLSRAGVNLPQNYIPQGVQNETLQGAFQNKMLQELLGAQGAPQGPPQPGGAPQPGAPQMSGLPQMSIFDKMRMAGVSKGPRSIAEEVALTTAQEQAKNAAQPPSGPQLEDLVQSTQLIPSLTEVVNEARRFSTDGSFGGQLASTAKLGAGDFMYKHLGILPPDALGGKYHNVAGQFHARAFAPFAKGTRNAKFIEEHYGPHIIEGTDSPQLALQKAQDMAAQFADQIDAYYRTTGKPAPANPWRQFLQSTFNSQGFESPSQGGAQQGGAQQPGVNPNANAMLQSYADQFFGGNLEAARAAATQSIARRYAR